MNFKAQLQKSFLLLSLLGIPQATLVAQNQSAAPGAPERSASKWDVDITDGTIQKDDGKRLPATLDNVISILRERYPANIVLAPGAGEIEVKDLKLNSFRWEQALEGMRVASGEAFIWNRNPVDPSTTSDADLLVISPITSKMPRSVEVFNLSGYFEEQKVPPGKEGDRLDEIEKIVLSTLDALGGPGSNRSIRFQFHDGAKLLVLIGSPESLDAARKVMFALPGVSPSQTGIYTPYGSAGGGPSTDATRDAMMRRYGLMPGAGLAPGPKRNLEVENAFRRRYGLGPAETPPQQTQPGGTEPSTPPVADPARK